MKQLHQAAADWLESIDLVATDMDGTLTKQGLFHPDLLAMLWRLHRAQISVVVVTGRSAGWVQGLFEYLPLTGAIAENGGVLYCDRNREGTVLCPPCNRQELAQLFVQIQREFPQLTPSADNAFRITDWTFEIQELSSAQLAHIAQRCRSQGWDFTYSSIQGHIKPATTSKQRGVLWMTAHAFSPPVTPAKILTLGDSLNDADLLNPAVFPHSVGVANLKPYLLDLPAPPTWMTEKAELAGFLEAMELLLAHRPIQASKSKEHSPDTDAANTARH
ncbi:HAD family hydrolase [Lyngbya confervoides]|uniref:Cof-type HAD-IIB family hydrolase n=1 Tax=Lyngbya confervoides BDU141951 TaxID=1574623 RepID=A0ABD4SYH7_9CYAN|nr:HAD family hydrolase [Lyngbya confervoides]MCM1981496.1 Cof-type HAD-IIB family hydrolase [Lyngbya confervoides BDU141951]